MKKLNEWVIEWLKVYKRIMIKPSTYDSYVTYATHVTCDKLLTELTTQDIQIMINDMIYDGCSLSTIKHMLTLVRQSLHKARSLGLINNLGMLENLELPKSRQKKIKPLRPEQVQLILNNSWQSFYGDFFKALIFTGCRVGELIALRWCDIDYFNKFIYIRNTDYNGTLQEVKTEHGNRVLPLHGELARLIRRQYRGRQQDRVFLNTLGTSISYRSLLDSWKRFCSLVSLPDDIGFHVLRHTFAHTALRNGIPLKVVSAWLGHADVSITLNIYDSVDDYDLFCAAEKIDSIFYKAKNSREAVFGN